MIRGFGVKLEWSDVDAAYIATCPEFPGLTGVSSEAEAALLELREAMEMAIEVLEEDGIPLPERHTRVEHSGQFRLRIARSLHAALAERAETEGVSLNAFASMVLAGAVGEATAQTQVAAQLQRILGDLRAEAYPSVRGAATRSKTVSLGESNDFAYPIPATRDYHQ